MPALLDGRVSSVISRVIKVTTVTTVNNSVSVRMAPVVILLQEIAHVRQAIKDKGRDYLQDRMMITECL